ncbi:hypothetical protein HY091_00445 [Candidatus Kaiserbacteria bacterium]|nr:hypothetical protein [Candidatus Kaiserbacteria bacterium]
MDPNNPAAPAAPVEEKPALELHFPDTEIDNPSVFTRTCLSGAVHAQRAAGLDKGYGYAMLLVARNEEDTEGFREIREVFSPSEIGRYLTFRRPGKWEVSLFLFERTNMVPGKNTTRILERDLKAYWTNKSELGRNSYYKRSLPDFSSIKVDGPLSNSRLSANRDSWSSGIAIAKYNVSVEVPADIFAKDRSPFLMGYANYFHKYPPYDDCDFRDRLIGMIPGFVPWLIIEMAKRVLFLVAGLLFLLFAVKGSPRLIGFSFRGEPKLSVRAAISSIGGGDGESDLMDFFAKKKYGWLLTPGMLILESIVLAIITGGVIVVAVLLWDVLKFLMLHPATFFAGVMGIGGLLLILFGLPRLFKYVGRWKKAAVATAEPSWDIFKGLTRAFDRLMDRIAEGKRGQTIAYGHRQAEMARSYATEIVCGDAPKAVSLAALPAATVTLRTRWDAFLRDYCRPFA